jgi:hypothetical protein
MPIEEQGGLRLSRVRTSECGRIIGSRWAGRAGAVALPRRRAVGESEFSAGLGSPSARIQDLRHAGGGKKETHTGCEQIGGAGPGPSEADSRCGTRVSVGLMEGGEGWVCGRHDARKVGREKCEGGPRGRRGKQCWIYTRRGPRDAKASRRPRGWRALERPGARALGRSGARMP